MRPSSTPRATLTVTACSAVLALGLVAVGSSSPAPAAYSSDAPVRAVAASAAARVAGDNAVRHVVAISVDGLNPDAIRKLGRDRVPALYRLIRNGASTLNARSVFELTRTLPNHTSMLTGRRIDVAAAGHGVDFNDDEAKTTVRRAAGEYVASVFDVVHDHGLRTALFTGKDKFALFDRSWNADNGATDRVGTDDGRDKIDRFTFANEPVLVRKVNRELRADPRAFTFVHLADPDKQGHETGYLQRKYLRAVVDTDRQIGRIMNAIVETKGLRAHTVLIVTSDHGGRGFGHDDPTRASNYTVPFFVWGVGVTKGANLYDLNSDYRRPGNGRPDYGPTRQPIRNAAVADLALDLLDLPAVPGSQVNASRNLDVARP